MATERKTVSLSLWIQLMCTSMFHLSLGFLGSDLSLRKSDGVSGVLCPHYIECQLYFRISHVDSGTTKQRKMDKDGQQVVYDSEGRETDRR